MRRSEPASSFTETGSQAQETRSPSTALARGLRRPQQVSFESLVKAIAVPVKNLHRLSLDPNTEPYWARDASHRFDDPSPPTQTPRFGVLYCARNLKTAFSESVIHGNSTFRNNRYEVSRQAIRHRQLVTFAHPHHTHLQLADLTGERLKGLGLNNDLCSGDDYSLCQEWSKAIYHALPHVDGIRYFSRQNNGHYCYAIFERSGLVRGDTVALDEKTITVLCKLFNVDPLDENKL